ANIEQVRADPDLLAGNIHAVVPALFQHRLAERLGTVGVGSLTNGKVSRLLVERNVVVEGCDAGLPLGGDPAAGAFRDAGDGSGVGRVAIGAEGLKTFDDGGHRSEE